MFNYRNYNNIENYFSHLCFFLPSSWLLIRPWYQSCTVSSPIYGPETIALQILGINYLCDNHYDLKCFLLLRCSCNKKSTNRHQLLLVRTRGSRCNAWVNARGPIHYEMEKKKKMLHYLKTVAFIKVSTHEVST